MELTVVVIVSSVSLEEEASDLRGMAVTMT